jgi:hypothetical protein
MSGLDDLFGELKDSAIPGGCDMCDAFQTVETVERGVHIIHVNHDDWCPVYRAICAEGN